MVKIYLSGRGGKGTLEFQDDPRSYPMGFSLKFNKRIVRKDIVDYLTTKRDFSIPESQRLDDYRVDNKRPIDHITYFWLALCELKARLDVEFKETEKK